MKNKFKFLIFGVAVILPIFLLCSCGDSEGGVDFISDEARVAHIQDLQGGNDDKVITKNDARPLSSLDAVAAGSASLEGMSLVLNNSGYQLYIDFENTAVAVYDKETGDTYHSDPTRTETHDLARYSADICPPMLLEAYDNQNKKYEFNVYDNCIEEEKEDEEVDDETYKTVVVVKNSDTSLRIIYTIGNDPDKELCPPVITEGTWDWIDSQLKANTSAVEYSRMKSYLTSNYRKVTPDDIASDIDLRETLYSIYPTLDYLTLYISYETTLQARDRIATALETAGFTTKMLKEEMEKAEYQGPQRAVLYTIPVDLSLEDDGLVVNVDTSLILAPAKQKLHKIYLYRGLGAVRSTERDENELSKEYMIIPDGSGAIMRLNGNKTTDAYTSRIYGADETFNADILTGKSAQVLTGFAVFDRGSRGSMMTVLEDGNAQAFISAKPVNGSNILVASLNYDLVYSERDYRTYSGGQGSGGTTGSSTDSSGSGVVLAKDQVVANFKIRYILGEGGKTYSEYSELYRNYLIRNGLLPSEKKANDNVSLYIDFIGAIDKSESVVGIPVTNKKPLTTYNQAAEILQKLREDGVTNVAARYSYWANGGYYNTAANKLNLLDSMGSEAELNELISYCKSNGIDFFPSAEFMYVYADIAGDGITYNRNAARRLDMRQATVRARSLATGALKNESSYKTILSADVLETLGEAYKTSYEKLIDNKQIALGSIGKSINSNYRTKDPINRTKALEHQLNLIDIYNDYDMMFDTGNDYIWKYASYIINMPLGSSDYLSMTESIPFIQMVLHGYVSYAGTPMNINANYKTSLLACLETGSNPVFRWIGESDTIFENTEYSEFFSLNYNNTYDQAVSMYKELASTMDSVSGLAITEHKSVEAYRVGPDGAVVLPEVTTEGNGNTTPETEGVQAPDAPETPDGETPETEEDTQDDTSVEVNLIKASYVFQTTYGGSKTVYVNYNSFDVQLRDGTVIPANGYIWR